MNKKLKNEVVGKVTASLPEKTSITLKVNGVEKQLEVAPWTTLPRSSPHFPVGRRSLVSVLCHAIIISHPDTASNGSERRDDDVSVP
jgi:hypothetical protein